MKETEHGYGAV